MNEQKKPGVGVSVIIIEKDKILLGKRKGSHREGTLVTDKNPIAVTNDIFEKKILYNFAF